MVIQLLTSNFLLETFYCEVVWFSAILYISDVPVLFHSADLDLESGRGEGEERSAAAGA